jgi:hypothetical protein
MTAAEDVDAVRAAALDYVEGWFDGDGARMQRALHPELVKRDRDQGIVRTLSAQRMIDLTVDGEGRREDADDRQIEIEIDHVSGDIASVTCLCHLYVDLLQLIRVGDEWRIVNAVWRWR